MFLGVSYLLDDALTLPLDKGDFLSGLNVTVYNFVGAIAYGLCLFLAWRCVGRAAELRKFISINFYYAGVSAYILSITTLAVLAIEKEVSPHLYMVHYKSLVYGSGLLDFWGPISQTLANDIMQKIGIFGSLLFIYLMLISFIPIAVWVIVGWGAYRHLTLLSKFQSILALALFIVFLFPVAGLLGLVGLLLRGLFAQETSS